MAQRVAHHFPQAKWHAVAKSDEVLAEYPSPDEVGGENPLNEILLFEENEHERDITRGLSWLLLLELPM